MIVEKFINTIDWNNGFYTIGKTELKDIITKVSDIQYGRGYKHGICFWCKTKDEYKLKKDLTADEICGKMKECEQCKNKERIDFANNRIVARG